VRIHLTFGFLFLREGGGSHGLLKYFLLKILERYFLPKILKRYFLPKYLRDPFLSGSDERFSPWWLSLQILYNEGFPWRKGNGESIVKHPTYDLMKSVFQNIIIQCVDCLSKGSDEEDLTKLLHSHLWL
jgi:hypothetical protein